LVCRQLKQWIFSKRCIVSFYPFLFWSVWHGEKKRNLVSTKRPKHESCVVQTSEHKNGKKIILIYWQCHAFSSRFTCNDKEERSYWASLVTWAVWIFLYETLLCWKKTLHKGNRKSIKTRKGSRLAKRFPYCGFFIVCLVFHTPVSTFSVVYFPGFPHSTFPPSSPVSALCVFHTPRVLHLSFSALLVFHIPHFSSVTLLLKQCF